MQKFWCKKCKNFDVRKCKNFDVKEENAQLKKLKKVFLRSPLKGENAQLKKNKKKFSFRGERSIINKN